MSVRVRQAGDDPAVRQQRGAVAREPVEHPPEAVDTVPCGVVRWPRCSSRSASTSPARRSRADFDRADANLSRVPLRVDEQGRRELAAAGLRWLEEAGAVQQRALDRAREGDLELEDVGLVLLIFGAVGFTDRAARG